MIRATQTGRVRACDTGPGPQTDDATDILPSPIWATSEWRNHDVEIPNQTRSAQKVFLLALRFLSS
jgi:hypothetical protein